MQLTGLLSMLSLGATVAAAQQAAALNSESFQIDDRLKVELFAKEPDVVDPVSLCFDESGRMYVVEMRDFPYGIGPEKKAGGTVRLLMDTNGDGRADKSTIFATDLRFPTSITPWKGGVFVTAPPEIIYLKDTDGDGVADVRDVYFSGFVLGVTDSNVNGLRWGLDDRIHGLNGGNGGMVKSLKRSSNSEAVNLENADFSFDPESGDFKTTYQTSGGFGLVFDDFGHSFVTYNINHIQQRILPLRYLNRFPGMLAVEATQSISDHQEMAAIYPISTAQTRPNHPEQAGYFSSAGGVGYIGYDIYPGDLAGSVTVGDVVGNIVHRDVLELNGSIFRAHRSKEEVDHEFIASRDNACRMTGLELGPDGALYLIDMQRDVIEHPDYIPEKLKKTLDLRAGENRGRIYRVTPRSGLPKEQIDLSKATEKQLVQELESHNQWRRQTAQRLLVERKATKVAPEIESLAARSKFAPGRVQALWTLAGMNELRDHRVLVALKDSDAGVRENAVKLAERSARNNGLINGILNLSHDPSEQTRFQVALSLGEFTGPEVQQKIESMLLQNRQNQWIRIAALSSLRSPADSFPIVLSKARSGGAEEMDLIRDLADVAVARSEVPAGRVLDMLRELDSVPKAEVAVAALDGMDRGLTRNPLGTTRLPFSNALEKVGEKSPETFLAAWKVRKRLGLPDTGNERDAINKAVKIAQDAGADSQERQRNLRLLGFGDYEIVSKAIFANLGVEADANLQSIALAVLSGFRDAAVAQELVAHWSGLAPSVRGTALNLLLSRKTFHGALLTALEQGNLTVGELNLDLEQRRTLLRESTPEIQSRAAKLISDEEYSNRKSMADQWLKQMPETGSELNGKAVFEKTCSICHRLGGVGHSVGPDLASVAHRSVEDILFNVIDPNMAINPKYLNFLVDTKDGESASGIVEQANSESVTLLQPSELRTRIPRSSITRMRSTGTSLMPEGLEGSVTPKEMRDLIAFIQSGGNVK